MSAIDREQAVAKALKVLESQADIIGRYDWEDSSSQAVLEAFWILRGALPVLETTEEIFCKLPASECLTRHGRGCHRRPGEVM